MGYAEGDRVGVKDGCIVEGRIEGDDVGNFVGENVDTLGVELKV